MQHLRKILLMPCVVLLCGGHAAAQVQSTRTSAAQPAEAIVTGGKAGTYYPMGNDLARLVADPSGLRIEVRESKGSVQNVIEISETPGVALGMVQSDVYQHFVDLAASGDVRAKRLLSALRVMLPLHYDEVHFIVAANSPLKYVHEIKDSKIYMDVIGSGTRLTGVALYRALFGLDPQSGQQIVEPFIRTNAIGDTPANLHRNSAFMSLVDKSVEPGKRVDVVLFNAGQPAAALKDLMPGAVRLLEVDPGHPSTQRVKSSYYKLGKIDRSSYTWSKTDVPTFVVQNYLITARFQNEDRNRTISNLAKALCARFPSLVDQGHPKWRTLDWKPGQGEMPTLGRGWTYAESSRGILQACGAAQVRSDPQQKPVSDKACTEAQRAMMLCR